VSAANAIEASPSSLDRACSGSCTKAGITALVFSAFALSLLHPLMQVDALQALGTYASARFRLKAAFTFFESDPCWEALRTESGLEKYPLARLKDRHCFYLADGKIITDVQAKLRQAQPPPAPARSTSKTATPSLAPSAPTNVMMGGPPLALGEIQEALSVLGQRETLRRAGLVFPFRFGLNLHWWQRRAFALGARTDSNYKVDVASYHFDESLSVDDIRLLVDFMPLDPSTVEQAIVDETRVTLPNAKTSLTLGVSSNLVQFGILLSVFLLLALSASRP